MISALWTPFGSRDLARSHNCALLVFVSFPSVQWQVDLELIQLLVHFLLLYSSTRAKTFALTLYICFGLEIHTMVFSAAFACPASSNFLASRKRPFYDLFWRAQTCSFTWPSFQLKYYLPQWAMPTQVTPHPTVHKHIPNNKWSPKLCSFWAVQKPQTARFVANLGLINKWGSEVKVCVASVHSWDFPSS